MITYYHSTSRKPELAVVDKVNNGTWVNCVNPTENDLDFLASEFGLDKDLLRDASDLYESPRVETEDKNVYVYVRYCYPEGQDIATEPILIVYTSNLLITVVRTRSPIFERIFSGKLTVVTSQRTKLFLQLLSEINHSYQAHIHAVSKQVLSFRSRLSKTDIRNEVFINFIDMEENLNEFLAALEPQKLLLRTLLNGKYFTLYENDKDMIEDIFLSTSELIEIILSRLKTISNTREAYATIMANNLNKTFRRLTSISIFMTIPAITAALYGMNLKLPLADSQYAFWLILVGVAVITGVTIQVFRKLRWL